MIPSLENAPQLSSLATEWNWFLTGSVDEGDRIRHMPLNKSQFTVGRKPDRDLCLSAGTVSGKHNEILVTEEALILRDQGSTNGT